MPFLFICDSCRGTTAVPIPSVTVAGEATELELCTSVLELLQWKEDIQDEAQLLPPLNQLLQQLLALPALKPQPQATAPAAMDVSDDEEQASDDEDAPGHAGAANR